MSFLLLKWKLWITIEDESLVQSIATTNLRMVLNENDRSEAREQSLAIRFIQGSNKKYRGYLTHLRNSFLDQNDNYPKLLQHAYNVLQHRELEPYNHSNHSDGIAFTTSGSVQSNRSIDNRDNMSNDKSHITCYKCGKHGHYADQCQSQSKNSDIESKNIEQETNLCTVGVQKENGKEFLFYQNRSLIPNSWILLDNQSTVDIFCKKSLLQNIQKSENPMKIQCNAGSRTTNLKMEIYQTMVPCGMTQEELQIS
jgi:Zinc knuckle